MGRRRLGSGVRSSQVAASTTRGLRRCRGQQARRHPRPFGQRRSNEPPDFSGDESFLARSAGACPRRRALHCVFDEFAQSGLACPAEGLATQGGTMKSTRVWLGSVLLAMGIAGSVFSCSGNNGAPAAGDLRLALSGYGPNGVVYRLRDATFDLTGVVDLMIDAEAGSPNAPVLTRSVPSGNYQLFLRSGWRLEGNVDGGFVDVEAELVSANPAAFTIHSGSTTDVTFLFRVIDVGDVNMAPGLLAVRIDVVTGDAAVPDAAAPDAGAVDAGSSDTGADAPPALCDPVAQTGCAPGEKCTAVLISDSPQVWQTRCAPAGTVPAGGACTAGVGVGEPDDCVAGTFCLDNSCELICDSNAAPAGCNCVAFAGLFEDRTDVGVCQPVCSVLAQNCPAAQACYLFVGTGEEICATPSGTKVQGEDCMFINDCSPGYGCTLINDADNPTGNVCAFFCDPTESGGPSCADGPGAVFTCVRINEFYSDAPVDSSIGFCIDCTQYALLPACGP